MGYHGLSWVIIGLSWAFFGYSRMSRMVWAIRYVPWTFNSWNEKAFPESIEKEWNTDSMQIKIAFLKIRCVDMIFYIVFQRYLLKTIYESLDLNLWSAKSNEIESKSFLYMKDNNCNKFWLFSRDCDKCNLMVYKSLPSSQEIWNQICKCSLLQSVPGSSHH